MATNFYINVFDFNGDITVLEYVNKSCELTAAYILVMLRFFLVIVLTLQATITYSESMLR